MGPNVGCFGWGPKKFMLKKLMCFFCPLVLSHDPLVESSEKGWIPQGVSLQ